MITTTIRIESWRRSSRRSMQQSRRANIAKAPIMGIRTVKA